jgi:hypothetical protein
LGIPTLLESNIKGLLTIWALEMVLGTLSPKKGNTLIICTIAPKLTDANLVLRHQEADGVRRTGMSGERSGELGDNRAITYSLGGYHISTLKSVQRSIPQTVQYPSNFFY